MLRKTPYVGFVARIAIALLGLILCRGLGSGTLIGWLLGLVGVALILTALGVAEFAMAVWYRTRRWLAARRARAAHA